jgi:quinol monooxygenase YgiN
MSATLIAVALGTVIAAAGTGALTARCVRAPRLFVGLSAAVLFALTVGLGAQALGYLSGYGQVAFRAMELGAQVVALLGLSLVLVEILGKSVPARFAMRLAVAAIGIVAIVVLGSDPLNPNATFSTGWPNPALYYEPAPRLLIEFVLAPFAGSTAVVSLLVAGYRIGRGRDDRRAAWPAVGGAFAVLALALPGLALLASRHVGLAIPLSARGLFTLGGVAAAVLGAAAGISAERRRNDIPAGIAGPGHGTTGGPDAAAWAGAVPDESQWAGQPGYGTRAAWPGDAVYPGGPGSGPAGQSPALGYDMDTDLRYPGLAALVAGDGAAAPGRAVAAGRSQGPDWYANEPGFGAAPGHGSESGYRADGGYGPPAGSDPATGVGPDDGGGDEESDEDAGQRRPGEPDQHARLFGQIVIYSLVDERPGEFDRLTERLVSAIQANEPDTLVYIVHQVPTAPLQRILYEVYLDRAAFEDHLRQPYFLRYDGQRQPLVAAMNVIELGLQQAKVTPFPTISEILTESGIDLTGVTRSRRRSRPPARQSGPESSDRAAGRDRGSPAGQPRAPGADPGAAHSVLLLSRPGCHLCDDARAVVEKVTAEFGVPWTERDVTVSEQDLRSYGDMIPVVFVDGVQHDFWRVDADRLRHALSG